MAKEQDKKGMDLIEDPEALAEQINKSEEFVKKNKTIIGGAIGVIAVAIVAAVYFGSSSGEKEFEAQLELYPAQYYYEQDSLDAVLNGNNGAPGVLDVAEDYSGTKAGNLANFYAGVAFLKKGEFDQAIESLKKFESSDLLVQARAYSLIGDAYLEKGELSSAIEYYQKAVDYKQNKSYTPRYMLKLALAQELNGKLAEAVKTYETLETKFPKATEVTNAKKNKAKVKAQLLVSKG